MRDLSSELELVRAGGVEIKNRFMFQFYVVIIPIFASK